MKMLIGLPVGSVTAFKSKVEFMCKQVVARPVLQGRLCDMSTLSFFSVGKKDAEILKTPHAFTHTFTPRMRQCIEMSRYASSDLQLTEM